MIDINVPVRKTFVLDTSVLVYHEDSIHAFPESNVVIPMEVLEEVDGLKTRHDAVGNAARYVNRFLDNLRGQGSLCDGVALDNGEVISVSLGSNLGLLPDGMADTRDNRIISIAVLLSKEVENVVLVSRDINVRVRCDSLGIASENYSKDKAVIRRRGAFTGVSVLNMPPSKVDKFYDEGRVCVKEAGLQPNEFIVLKGGRQSALAKFREGEVRPLVYASSANNFNVQGVSPRSKEQVFAMDMLLDPSIHMATITGRAGSGKTLLSIATAIHQLNEGIYDRIIISRPVQSTSNDIGFLPGDLREKMGPWLQPIFDNLKVVMKNGDSYIDLMIEKGIIEIQALAHIRGRSLPRAIFILDESQNITLHEAKAVITRMGEGSKLILLGDLEQIDAPHLDSSTCGLGVIVEKFKDFELASHITLLKGERSPLATHAAKIL